MHTPKVDDLTTQARLVAESRVAKVLPEPCSICHRRTVVAYLTAGVIRCERDLHTGEHD